MKPNVFIRSRKRGKLCHQWEGHNTWTTSGRTYLAQMLAFTSLDPDVPVVATSRIKWMNVGVGGNQQGILPGPVDTGYPAGFDPHATSGDEYSHTYPEAPHITTLERPVRITGGTNPYASAAGSDVWLSTTSLPKWSVARPAFNEVSFRFFIDGPAGDVAYSTFTSVPLTEAGLVLSSVGNPNAAYNAVAAYVNFEPLIITDEVEAEILWVISF